jgi:hypothetical protein
MTLNLLVYLPCPKLHSSISKLPHKSSYPSSSSTKSIKVPFPVPFANIAVTFFSWGTLGIGGAIVARRWYASTKKRFHLITGIVNAAGCAAFFGGVPLAGANETLGATLTFLGFLAIAATPLVQISRAPAAGEKPAAPDQEGRDVEETE